MAQSLVSNGGKGQEASSRAVAGRPNSSSRLPPPGGPPTPHRGPGPGAKHMQPRTGRRKQQLKAQEQIIGKNG